LYFLVVEIVFVKSPGSGMRRLLALWLVLLGVAAAQNCCPEDQGFGSKGIGFWKFTMEEKGFTLENANDDFKIDQSTFTTMPTIQAPWDDYFNVEADSDHWILTVMFIMQG
jgi:hypothetical protein